MNRIPYHQTSRSLYDFSAMKCVDPDNLVFAEKESEDAWTFYQITNLKILERFQSDPEKLIAAYNQPTEIGNSVSDELNKHYSVVSFTVDLSRENEDVRVNYKKELAGIYPDDWGFLSCEDIFQQEATESIIKNVLKQDPHYYE